MKFRHVKKEIHGHFVFLWDDIRRNLILTNGLGRYRYNFDLICQNDMILSTENIFGKSCAITLKSISKGCSKDNSMNWNCRVLKTYSLFR